MNVANRLSSRLAIIILLLLAFSLPSGVGASSCTFGCQIFGSLVHFYPRGTMYFCTKPSQASKPFTLLTN
jgi:hypothetical protein